MGQFHSNPWTQLAAAIQRQSCARYLSRRSNARVCAARHRQPHISAQRGVSVAGPLRVIGSRVVRTMPIVMEHSGCALPAPRIVSLRAGPGRAAAMPALPQAQHRSVMSAAFPPRATTPLNLSPGRGPMDGLGVPTSVCAQAATTVWHVCVTELVMTHTYHTVAAAQRRAARRQVRALRLALGLRAGESLAVVGGQLVRVPSRSARLAAWVRGPGVLPLLLRCVGRLFLLILSALFLLFSASEALSFSSVSPQLRAEGRQWLRQQRAAGRRSSSRR